MLGQIRFFILFNVTFLIKIIGYQIITYALTEPLKKIPEAGVVLKNPLSRSRFYKIHWSRSQPDFFNRWSRSGAVPNLAGCDTLMKKIQCSHCFAFLALFWQERGTFVGIFPYCIIKKVSLPYERKTCDTPNVNVPLVNQFYHENVTEKARLVYNFNLFLKRLYS